MKVSRRELLKIAGISIGSGLVPQLAFGQVAPIRLPLHEFVQNDQKLKSLRRGVAGMKSRKPSDPLSWFYQAAIHGVTEQLFCEAADDDPDIFKVDRDKYWNQCPHFGQNSANFLPWHRAYTYHFEKILRLHVGEDDFALPYWDYSLPSQKTFPKEFGIEHLDGDVSNNDPKNINPLFHAQRDFFLCGYEHPFTDQLPLTELSSRAVDSSRALSAVDFFGDDESSGLGGGVYDSDTSTRGLLEQSPHDQIHRAVGGVVTGVGGDLNPGTSIGGMAIPMTAGFDPIFPIHHSNIDRLWALWSCMPGRKWGTLPAQEWFDEKPWFFFDTDGEEVNLPRKEYFDYRKLGVSFKDEDLSCTPLELPTSIVEGNLAVNALERSDIRVESQLAISNSSRIVIDPNNVNSFPLIPNDLEMEGEFARFSNANIQRLSESETVLILVHNIEAGNLSSNGLDVYLVEETMDENALTKSDKGYLGAINLFVHSMKKKMRFDQTFDATQALVKQNLELNKMKVVFKPYDLMASPTFSGELPIDFGSKIVKASEISIVIR